MLTPVNNHFVIRNIFNDDYNANYCENLHLESPIRTDEVNGAAGLLTSRVADFHFPNLLFRVNPYCFIASTTTCAKLFVLVITLKVTK